MSGTQPVDGLAALTASATSRWAGRRRAARGADPDVVLNAIVGFAGVEATLWALEHGVTLALANKESLVAAGELAVAAHRRGGGLLLPVDSEHSALFQCLEGREPETVEALVLTASGGPFRGRTRGELDHVTVAEALAHPTWSMGRKITVDSATLANKGLELIEAHWLFGIPYDRDRGRRPPGLDRALARALPGRGPARASRQPRHARADLLRAHVPRAAAAAAPPLDLAAGSTSASRGSTTRRSRCCALAREAGVRGGTFPCAYNAANEVAVAAFLDGASVSPRSPTPSRGAREHRRRPARDLADLVEADEAARRAAAEGLQPA